MIQGVIKKLTPSFPASGQPTLVITGLNQLDKLRKKQESHPYKNKTDSQIAKQIAGRLGVKIRTDAAAEGREEAHPYLAQRNEYDILFLLERARRIGYELSIDPSDPGQLYFGPSVNVRKVAYHLSYGKSLIQFQPNLDTSNQVAQVRVVGWDNNKQLIQATVTRGEIATRGVNCKALRDALEASFKDKEEVINDVPLGSQQEARTIARETLENIAKQMVTGSGSTVGLPGLRAGTVLMIDGLDECFGGRYFVTSTTHTIGDGGYTTQFECRREEI
jgi:phage protein D